MRAKVLHLKDLRHLAVALFVSGNSHHVVIRSAFGNTDILILAIFVLYEFKYRNTIDSVCLEAGRRILLYINQSTCIQLKLLYIIFFQGRQRKNIGRLLRNFHNFELASKCEVPAKNDMEISLSSWKNLFALCLEQKLKPSLPPSKQVLLYHANRANLILYSLYILCREW